MPSVNLSSYCDIEYNTIYGIILPKNNFLYSTNFCHRKKCKFGYYKCQFDHNCIPLNLICDDIMQCRRGDDEINCGIKISFLFCHKILL